MEARVRTVHSPRYRNPSLCVNISLGVPSAFVLPPQDVRQTADAIVVERFRLCFLCGLFSEFRVSGPCDYGLGPAQIKVLDNSLAARGIAKPPRRRFANAVDGGPRSLADGLANSHTSDVFPRGGGKEIRCEMTATFARGSVHGGDSLEYSAFP